LWGGTHSDYYEGETHTIQGKVMGALEEAQVTLYLDDKSEPIAKANVEADGSYVLKFTPEVHDNIVKNKYALLSADGKQKSFKSIVAFYDSNSSKAYSYKDTMISGYTDAVYKVKSALLFDKNTSKILVKKFMPLYVKGKYDSTVADAYAFAYNGAMDELAEHNEYDNEKSFEVLQKLATLNKEDVEVAKENGAFNYSFAVVEKIDDNVVSEEITFDINENILTVEESTSYSLKKINVGASNYFDGAKNFEISVDNNNSLSNVNTSVFDSNQSVTESNQGDSFFKFTNKTTTSIIDNLNIELDLNSSINKEPLNQEKSYLKGHTDCIAIIYQHNAWASGTDFHEKWIYKATRENVALRSSNLNFLELSRSYGDPARAYKIVWKVRVDGDVVKMVTTYTFYDYENYYRNAVVAGLNTGQTNYSIDNSFDNNFKNSIEYSTNENGKIKEWVEPWVLSHTITDFDKIVNVPVGGTRTKAWRNSDYSKNKVWRYLSNESSDTRKPLLLIHGWQAVKIHAERNMAVLRDYEHNEFEYWHNFISYYLTTPELYTRYKLYTYHYPSYKHITFNARKLKELLNALKANNDTLLGRVLNDGREKSVAIIAHSMGGLVARSMIEEHKGLGTYGEDLAKLITLDTPHHGSQGANLLHTSPYLAHNTGKKDLKTAGSVDLMWDNYDDFYKGSDFNWIVNPNKENNRLGILNDGGNFDNVYIRKLAYLNSNHSYTIKSKTNPFLAYLNKNFRINWANIAGSDGENKYIFYVAHTSSDKVGEEIYENPIDTTWAYILSSLTFNWMGAGYGSGGAEPVCSAFFTKQDAVDRITRFPGDFERPEKFIKIDNKGDFWNDNVAYRYFWDYDHESIMSGLAKERGSWDEFIDKSRKVYYLNDCRYTMFHDFDNNRGCLSTHYTYWAYASNFLYNGTNNTLSHTTLQRELSNPLTTEPLFMILQKDLLETYEGR